MPVDYQPAKPASPEDGRYAAYLATAEPPPHVPMLHRLACQRIRQIACEKFGEIVGRDMVRRDRRHAMSHIRQIAIYVCHVSLSLPLAEVAACFGRDRSTVSVTCNHVEDRRDDEAFDEFVTAVEQAAKSVIETLQAGAA